MNKKAEPTKLTRMDTHIIDKALNLAFPKEIPFGTFALVLELIGTQLAHSQKEVDALRKEERQDLGAFLGSILEDDTLSVDEQSIKLLETINCLEQGKSPIKEGE